MIHLKIILTGFLVIALILGGAHLYTLFPAVGLNLIIGGLATALAYLIGLFVLVLFGKVPN